MPIRAQDTYKFDSFINGIDDTSPVDSQGLERTLSVALNCDITDDSLVKKRNGYTVYNATPWSGIARIRKGFEYVKSDGTLQTLCYGEANPVTGTSGKLGYGTTPTITDIKTGLLDNVQPSIIQIRNLAFVFNGQDDFLYDGSTTRQIGITAPSSAPTLASNTNGSLVVGASYLVGYTYYNANTGAESSISPFSAPVVINADPNDGITVTYVDGSATTATHVRFYRSVANGSTLFFDKQVALGSTTTTLIQADSGLGDQNEPDNSRLPGTAKYAIVQDNRVFVAGFSANKNRVQYSKIGQNGSMPESFQVDDFVDCNINDGDQIIGLNRVNSVVLVLKQKSVGRLTPISTPSTDPELAGSRKYIYEEIARDITSISNEAFLSVDTFALWLGIDDIYATDGYQLFRSSTSPLQTTTNGLARRILKTYRTLNFSQKNKFSAINKVETKQIIFTCPRSSQIESDFQIVAHYRNFPIIAFTYYGPGSNTTTHPGLTAASLFQGTEVVGGVSQRVYYFGDSGTSGQIYKFDSGTNDNGKGIYWDCRLPWDANNDPSVRKLFHSYYLFAVGDGSGDSITHTFEREKLEFIVSTATTSLLLDPGSTWGSPTWSNFVWASTSLRPLQFFPRQLVHYGRYGWNNTQPDQPFSIVGLMKVLQQGQKRA